MRLGDRVMGLMMDRHWRFVTDDQHNIAEAVQRHDRTVRLVCHEVTREIAVAKFIAREHLGENIERDVESPVNDRGGAYMLVFYPRRPDGQKMIGEPDSTVLDQLRMRDLSARRRGINEREILNEFEKIDRIREEAAKARIRDKLRENTARRLHDFASTYHLPWAPGRIFVPKGVDSGRR